MFDLGSVGTIDISVSHPNSLRSPINTKYCEIGLVQRILDFPRDCAVAKIFNSVPKIPINLDYGPYVVPAKSVMAI